MAVRSEGAAAMDEAAAGSTAIMPVAPPGITTGVSTAVPTEFNMGEDISLDLSVSPVKDESTTSIFPPASRQRRGASPASVTSTLAVRKRPSSAPRPARGKGARPSPWPDSASAVHGRVKVAGDGWTILQLVAQLDFDREQITMLKDAVEGLHASRLQDAADTLALTKRFDKRDFLDVDLKTNIQGVYNELKGDIGRAGLVQARVDVIESEITKMREFVANIETREVKMAQYLEKLDGDRPAEGQSIKEHFRAMYVDLETTKSHFAQSVASAEDVKMHLTSHVADTAAKFE